MMDELNKLLKELEQYVLDRQFDFVSQIFVDADLHRVLVTGLLFGIQSVSIEYEYRKEPNHFITIPREVFDNWYKNIRTMRGLH